MLSAVPVVFNVPVVVTLPAVAVIVPLRLVAPKVTLPAPTTLPAIVVPFNVTSPDVVLVLPVILVAPLVCVTPLANTVVPFKLTLPVFANVVLPAMLLFAPAKLMFKLPLPLVNVPVIVVLPVTVALPVTPAKLTLPALKVLTNVVFVAFAIVTLFKPLAEPPTVSLPVAFRIKFAPLLPAIDAVVIVAPFKLNVSTLATFAAPIVIA